MSMRDLKLSVSAAVLAALLAAGGGPARAATPADTLVMAMSLASVTSLDPHDGFEPLDAEIDVNVYEPLVGLDKTDPAKFHPLVATSWTISDDKKLYTFTIDTKRTFASGNPVTPEDVVYSIQRLVILNKSPAYYANSLGLTADNVKDRVKAEGPDKVTIALGDAYSPTFVLSTLGIYLTGILDRKLLAEHEVSGDWGNAWLATHSAGSGAFVIRDVRANEIITLQRNPHYAGKAPALARIIYRHTPESSAQRLQLERGDVDIARGLTGEDLEALSGNPDLVVEESPKLSTFYLGLSQKHPTLAKPEVQEALRYLVDYDAIAKTVMRHRGVTWQTILPKGMLGALDSSPYKLDVAKAKELLAKAGVQPFTVTVNTGNQPELVGTAEAIQKTFAEAGITLKILATDQKQALSVYRARKHDMYLGTWGSDPDPQATIEAFASNPDNSDATGAKTLAWRNSWDIAELAAELVPLVRSGLFIQDADKRAAAYQQIQEYVLHHGPLSGCSRSSPPSPGARTWSTSCSIRPRTSTPTTMSPSSSGRARSLLPSAGCPAWRG
jgi:peptide/nickel transport system substrate-binding protein